LPQHFAMTQAIINRHLIDAVRARDAGRPGDARRHFEAVLKLDPDHPKARNALGMEALAARQGAAAAAHFLAATRRDPAAPALWMNLASARRIERDDDGERAALEQVLEIDQAHLMANIRLAELHERRAEEANATARWSAVVALGGALPNAPPELTALVGHARDYVAQRRRGMADALDEAMAADLAAASPRDRRRLTAAADYMLGRRAIFANRCEGLHYPFLPADEFFDRDQFPWLAGLEEATPFIREELMAILEAPEPGLAPYVAMAKGTPQNQWTALDRSLDWSSLHLWREGQRIDQACARAPRTAALVESLPLARIPGRAPTVFFSILKAGSHIPPHTGVTNSRTIIHLPLIVPGECTFRVGGETREWREGEAFAFDDTIEHEAWNRSDTDRAVLILDVWSPHLSEHEREMICGLFAVADEHRDL
jgi:aspartate beta-hydroxylase